MISPGLIIRIRIFFQAPLQKFYSICCLIVIARFLSLYVYFGLCVYLNPRVINGSFLGRFFASFWWCHLENFTLIVLKWMLSLNPPVKLSRGPLALLETSGSNQINRDLDIQQSLLKKEGFIFVSKIGLLSFIHFFKAKEKVSMKDLELLFSNFYQKPGRQGYL